MVGCVRGARKDESYHRMNRQSSWGLQRFAVRLILDESRTMTKLARNFCAAALALVPCVGCGSTARPSGGATGGTSGFVVPEATGGATSVVNSPWTTTRQLAPGECQQDNYEVLTNAYLSSRFVFLGESMYVTWPYGTSSGSSTDLDEIRLSPYGKRTVYSGDGYGASVAATNGHVFLTTRPWDLIYPAEGKETYKVLGYDPATLQANVFVDGYALIVAGSPAGLVVGSTDYGQVTFYPTSGAGPVSLCTPNGYDSIVANSTAALVQSYRGMMLCGFDGAGASLFLPYPEYNGVSVRSIAIDETNAYLVHQDNSAADGIYRLDLTTKTAIRIATGSTYAIVRSTGSELWLSDTSGGIYRMPTDGSSAPTLVTNQKNVVQLEVHDGYVYWTRYTSDSIACIKRMPKP